MHPIWEGKTGWIGTGRHSLKEKHLASNPYVSLTYFDRGDAVYIEASAAWEDSPEEKERSWELFKAQPEPLGYDPGAVWPTGPNGEHFGLLKLTPTRVELSGPNDFMAGVSGALPA